MNESEPADVIEVCDVIEDLATAMAAANNGVVNLLELRRSVLETLGERLPMRLMPQVENHIQPAAAHAMKMHALESEIAEVNAKLKRKSWWVRLIVAVCFPFRNWRDRRKRFQLRRRMRAIDAELAKLKAKIRGKHGGA
jgi:hypothetical protein